MAETDPNRLYLPAAQTDRLPNGERPQPTTPPPIWGRLANGGGGGPFYYSHLPFTALWGTKYLRNSGHVSEFLTACAAGQLPSVSYVDPRFLDEGSGTSGDDHPHADIRAGQHFLASLHNAVTSSPNWSRTALVI